MKVKVSLSLKITVSIIILSAVTIATATYFNVYYQEQNFDDADYEKALALVEALNDTIGSRENLNDSFILQDKLDGFIDRSNEKDREIYKDILKISINLAQNDELMVAASSDNQTIGTTSDPYCRETESGEMVCCNIKCYEDGNTFYISSSTGDSHTLTFISPIYFEGEIQGTYEMILSMDKAYTKLDNMIRSMIAIAVVSLFVLVFGSIFFLRKSIVKPIMRFRETARVFGKGNLDARIDIKSKDELGDLATAFNQMAKDLKESRDKVQDYNQILEGLLQQKDEFIGQLGHDLKNPLQPLVGLLPMLIEQEKDPQIKETLELMNKNVEYMRELLFKTLQLARLRSSDIQFDFEKLNLSEVAYQVFDSEKLMLKEKGMGLEVLVPKEFFVEADRLRLAEVFQNLINNAVKYTKDTNGKITINATKKDDIVTVSVTDTGVGMTKDQSIKIFDEFYKAHVTTSALQSMGLGLSICKKIIERHKGKIWADSPGPGQGSTFYFTLKSL